MLKIFSTLATLVVATTGISYAADVNTQKNIGLSLATQITANAVASCAAKGYGVTATVVDRYGVIVSVARADNAGPHTLDGAYRKAYTSASMKAPSANISAPPSTAQSNVKDIHPLLGLGGGLPIKVGNEVIGAVGVGGAPQGSLDEACAQDALTKVASSLK